MIKFHPHPNTFHGGTLHIPNKSPANYIIIVCVIVCVCDLDLNRVTFVSMGVSVTFWI